MFLLDTNVVSELRRPEKANKNVLAWVSSHPISNFFISAITVLELELGVLQIARKDSVQGHILRTWMDNQVLPLFQGRILTVDTLIAQICAKIHVPNPCSERDALIAATALAHNMSVVTRNISDFEPTGVRIINPWNHP